MLIRLRDLNSLAAQGPEGAQHRVTDLLVSRDAPDVTHVVTQLGRWFDRHGCAIRIDAFAEPDLTGKIWPAAVGEADIRAAGKDGPVATICGVDAAPDPVDVAQTDGTGPLAVLSTIYGRPVKAVDGSVAGRIMDAVIDTESRKVAMLVVRSGPTVTENQRVVPMEMFTHIDWSNAEVHLRCDAKSVENSPDLHEVGAQIEGYWYNRVLAYYGIG